MLRGIRKELEKMRTEVWSPPRSADVTPSGGGCAVVRSQWWNQPYDELESKVIATLARRFSSVCATQSLHCTGKNIQNY
jgi:hypothetical protein